jgi:SET domain-containing protein
MEAQVSILEELDLFLHCKNEKLDQQLILSRKSYKRNETICSFSQRSAQSEPSYLSVQLDEEKHILLAPTYLQYINHSCDPNVFFDTSSMTLIALKSIEIGEELCFFYPSTEWEMIQPFKCHCKSVDCLGQIQGAKFLSKEQKAKYQFSEFIQGKFLGYA